MPFDPFSSLASQATKVGTDIWTAIMLSLWNVGLLLMRFVLQLEEHFLTPDLSEGGPAHALYSTTFWIAATFLLVMVMIQLGTAALRRDGKSLGRLLIGVGQFVIVWAAWLSYAVAVLAACTGLNSALMRTLFAADSLSGWDPLGGLKVDDITEVVTAGVLGLLGGLLCLASITHFVVILTRAGALIVLAATAPISAAGLVGDTGRAWFWKSLRWFHAAAFTPVVMTLIMGTGIQMASGVAGGQADQAHQAIGTALPAVTMMLISAVAPLALFKLLAFMDPGTNSGASIRMGLAALGGIPGLLGGQRTAGDAGTAAQTAGSGRAQGEAQGEAATSQRFLQGQANAVSGVGAIGGAAGAAGVALAAGLRGAAFVGGTAAAVATDTTNQMGVGHNTYQPDFSGPSQRGGGTGQAGETDASQPPDAGAPTRSVAAGGPPPPTGPLEQPTPPSTGGPGLGATPASPVASPVGESTAGGAVGGASSTEAATGARAAAVAAV